MRNDGGAAFPGFHIDNGVTTIYGGMSLRDYFAAAALQGLIASNDAEAGDRITELPEYAYVIADAMLTERAKP